MKASYPSHKRDALRASGTLNPYPERVLAPLFQGNPFFDADDVAQVKYEMLRCVEYEGVCVQHSANLYGFSRTTWYQVNLKYTRCGMLGLLPQRRGPQHPKKRVPVAMRVTPSDANMSNCVKRRLIRAD
jgi:hypothetical protein